MREALVYLFQEVLVDHLILAVVVYSLQLVGLAVVPSKAVQADHLSPVVVAAPYPQEAQEVQMA